MTDSKIKQMQTALLKYNELARELLKAPDDVSFFAVQECLKRGEEALKVGVTGRS